MSESQNTDQEPVPAEVPSAPEESSEAAAAPSPVEPEETTESQEAPSAAVVSEELPQQIEAILMATDRALPSAKLSELLGKVGVKNVNNAVAQLNDIYEKSSRSFRIEALAGGWQILTLPKYSEVVAALRKSRESAKLTPAAMETLAIVAYKQPITRAQIEAIRGVASGEVLRSLMERRIVKIVGRAEELGRPMLYGTTKAFLEVFGLASLKDLPKAGELKPKD